MVQLEDINDHAANIFDSDGGDNEAATGKRGVRWDSNVNDRKP